MASKGGTVLSELELFLRKPPPHWNSAPSSTTQYQSNDAVAIAHAALEYLRETGDEHFLFLRTVMELTERCQSTTIRPMLSGHEEEVLFHCITGCRQVSIWQYKSKYSPWMLRTVRDFMMLLGFEPASRSHGHVVSSKTIQMACFSTSVALWKRGWNELQKDSSSIDVLATNLPASSMEENLIQGMIHLTRTSSLFNLVFNHLHSPNDLFHCIERLVETNTPKIVECSALYLQTLVTEFLGRSSISYRLPLEFHKQAHRSFEKEGPLIKSLGLALTALGQVLTLLADGNVAPETFGMASSVVQLTLDCLGWEFGLGAWDIGKLGAASATSRKNSIRPPVEWKTILHPIPIVKALIHVILKLQDTTNSTNDPLSQSLRQLLLVMASLSGPIFQNTQQQQEFASALLEGTLQLLHRVDTRYENAYLMDVLQLLGRLVANFRLFVLAELASLLNPVLQGMAAIGQKLLQEQVQDCQRADGDLDSMELREWREEVISVLLMDCAVLLASDPWLIYSGTDTSRRQAQKHLASLILVPLYQSMVDCRTRMAALEEHFLVLHDTLLDKEREEITAIDLEEELEAISTVGRLNLESALSCLAERHSQIIPRLLALWGENGVPGVVSPKVAALLEEARLLTLYVSHLLTDANEGESPQIPLAVLQACQEENDFRNQSDATSPATSTTASINSAIQASMQFAEAQMHKIVADPTNAHLSPMLANVFLRFLQRWAPAYIYAGHDSSLSLENPIIHEWSVPEKAQAAVTFCITLCFCYQCYWPQEPTVQENSHRLLLALVRRGGPIRAAVVASPAFVEMVRFHCITAGIRHFISDQELENTLRNSLGEGGTANVNINLTMIRGFQKLPYEDRAQVFSTILIACSDSSDEASSRLFRDSLKVVHDAFLSLIQALDNSAVSHDDMNAKEMTCLCLAMLYGLTNASEMSDSERVPQFLTPFLPKLASLMDHYATDLTVCEKLLQIFTNYAGHFVLILDREQSLELFRATAKLLQSYSAKNWQQSRRIRLVHRDMSSPEITEEEEQANSDILCAIQLLINLGTKDFIDACSLSPGVDSSDVTEMIFFGLQQLLPLMTQGLLQFPTLCQQFFELVGFMVDTYPSQLCRLPFDLFNSLVQALLFGMSHHDLNVAKCSLLGLGSVAKEHLESQALEPILTQHAPDLLDQCLQRLFTEVIFRPIVVDRVESCGMALLNLAAADLPRLSIVMTQLCESTYQKDDRLKQALAELLTYDRLSKVSQSGYDGRMNRVLFKEAFQKFVDQVQSFLVLR